MCQSMHAGNCAWQGNKKELLCFNLCKHMAVIPRGVYDRLDFIITFGLPIM